jgi:glycosyltransferase involved in cell wall biosynthesis
MSPSLISIITPSYNSDQFVIDTYLSIKDQTHNNWEWLVTDDFSSDDTFTLLLKISQTDARVKPIRNLLNCGPAVSRNNSIARAAGEFIAFIDSDDTWERNKLEKQIEFMNHCHIDFCFTAFNIIDKDGVWTGRRVDFGRNESFGYHDILCKAATLGCSTVMLRRNAFFDIFMPLLRTGQDYALWLKLLKSGTRAHILGEALTNYRITPKSISRNKIRKAIRQWQIYREIEQLSLHYSMYCFSFYAFRAIFRR